MVRALKRLQTRLPADGAIEQELPSYIVECLVYNVPDKGFGHTAYKDDMRFVLATIFNATLAGGDWNDWEEVNGLRYLFRGKDALDPGAAHALASAAWDEIGYT